MFKPKDVFLNLCVLLIGGFILIISLSGSAALSIVCIKWLIQMVKGGF